MIHRLKSEMLHTYNSPVTQIYDATNTVSFTGLLYAPYEQGQWHSPSTFAPNLM
jgi:hypothetical protein